MKTEQNKTKNLSFKRLLVHNYFELLNKRTSLKKGILKFFITISNTQDTY